jgi:hypothetical protein
VERVTFTAPFVAMGADSESGTSAAAILIENSAVIS